jgi:tRNA pseudouridine13 synthase
MLSVSVKQLVGLNKNFHNVKLGNFRLRQGEALKLGDLSGNRFTITVREVSERSDELIRSGLESLKMKGFVNYFGLQRFGTCDEAPTHAIGK